ncbi:MAG: AMIN domain-containing protein, partial [Deltaproteobacteria bacterium]|nr:AMIN domain-containing protein [Deltaproteobacteria bacterium]
LLPKRMEASPPLETAALRPLGTADSVEIALLVDGPAGEHTSFWLDSPRRLVVDLHGRRSGFAQRTLLIDHPLAKRIRVGQHPDKVRFVIETAPDASPQVSARASGNALVIGIKRR